MCVRCLSANRRDMSVCASLVETTSWPDAPNSTRPDDMCESISCALVFASTSLRCYASFGVDCIGQPDSSPALPTIHRRSAVHALCMHRKGPDHCGCLAAVRPCRCKRLGYGGCHSQPGTCCSQLHLSSQSEWYRPKRGAHIGSVLTMPPLPAVRGLGPLLCSPYGLTPRV